jgi:hypothetical protein
MRSKGKITFSLILVALLAATLTGCSGKTSTDVQSNPQDEAAAALQNYFDDLHSEDYDGAVALYGGDYEWLIAMNPDIDPADHAALFTNGCRNNGFQCLQPLKITFSSQSSEDEFIFFVQFQNADGTQFVQGPCCGEDETTSPPVSEFNYTVTRNEAGDYQVFELPPYVP